MYVCICNALNDRELAGAAKGAKSVGEVFRRCGKRPQCGKCLNDIAGMIEDDRKNARGAPHLYVVAAE
ncbi:MAG: (2Fe-2S)-binding protein [Parvularculaceae bacterium]